MKDSLSHLSEKEINDLMERYYSGEKVKDLKDEFNIDTTKSLPSLFPPEVFPNYTCEYCGTPMVVDRPSKFSYRMTGYRYRALYKDNRILKDPDTEPSREYPKLVEQLYCPICHHQFCNSSCQCENCLEKARRIRQKKKDQIRKQYDVKHELLDYDELPLRAKLYLGVLFSTSLYPDCSEYYEIKPFNDIHAKLAPTDDLIEDIYLYLTENKILSVSPNSDVKAFDFDDNCNIIGRYLFRVRYIVNLKFSKDDSKANKKILKPDSCSLDDPEVKKEAIKIWRELALAECEEYLVYQLKLLGFPFNPGSKTHRVFNYILEHFTVRQAYNIIWKSTTKAARYYLEHNLGKRYSANTAIPKCEEYAQLAIDNNWVLTEYERPIALHQSKLASFFFENILGIGDEAYKNIIPSAEEFNIKDFKVNDFEIDKDRWIQIH